MVFLPSSYMKVLTYNHCKFAFGSNSPGCFKDTLDLEGRNLFIKRSYHRKTVTEFCNGLAALEKKQKPNQQTKPNEQTPLPPNTTKPNRIKSSQTSSMSSLVKTDANTSRDTVTRCCGYRSHSATEDMRSHELQTSALHLHLAAVRSNV